MSTRLAGSWRNVSRNNPCPICGRKSGCSVSADGAFAFCWRVADGAIRAGKSGGWLHRLASGVLTHPRALEALPIADAPLADPVRLDAVLRAVGRHPLAALARADRDGLTRRGLSADAIKRNAYSTLPAQGRSRIARDVAEAHDVSGVPGFYWSAHNGGYLTLAGQAGLAIPIRDREGRERGTQLRSRGKGYSWQSSANRTAGTGSGSPLHWTLAGSEAEGLWCTEGALKADVAAHLSGGHRFLAVAGVGMGARIADELIAVGWPIAKPIVLAFDADFRDKAPVLRATVSTGRAIREAGFTVQVATWDPTRGKGIDDALLAGAPIAVESWEAFVGEKPVAVRPGPMVEPERRETLTVAEAEAAIATRTRQLLRELPHGHNVLQGPCGVGKTATVLHVLADDRRLGQWPWTRRGPRSAPARICVLFDTTVKAEEAAAELLAAGLGPDDFALLGGRSERSCPRHREVRALGERRHSPQREACSDCEHGERSEDGLRCPYLDARERTRDAQLVLSTKEAVLLGDPRDLRTFDAVICDESLAGNLLETVELRLGDVQAWRAGLLAFNAGAGDHALPAEFLALFTVLEAALSTGNSEASRGEWEHALPVLDRIASVLGPDLSGLVRYLSAQPQPQGGRYPWESPWEHEGGQWALRSSIPLRAFRDLLESLAAELDSDETRTDSRLWLESLPEGGSVLRVYRPRQDVIAALRRRTVLVLDATPECDLAAYHAAFDGRVTVEVLDVEEPLHVVQLTNAIRQTDSVRRAIRDRERARLGPGQFVAVLTRKRLHDLDGDGDEGLRTGHFGAHHRAVNAYSGASTMIVEDHWQEPSAAARAWVECWRFGCAPDADPETYAPIVGQAAEGRRAGAGAESDHDVAEYTEARWGAELRQAVGRARACRHATPENPVRVVVECRLPVPGLRVDELVTAWSFLGWRDPSAGREENLRSGEAWESANLRKRTESEARIRSAVFAFLAEHERFPSVCELKRIAGGRKDRIARVLEQVRESLSDRSPLERTSTCTYAPSGDRPPREPDGGPPNGSEPPVKRVCAPSDRVPAVSAPNVVPLEPVGPQARSRWRAPRIAAVACRGSGA